jgi:hypothetical protein
MEYMTLKQQVELEQMGEEEAAAEMALEELVVGESVVEESVVGVSVVNESVVGESSAGECKVFGVRGLRGRALRAFSLEENDAISKAVLAHEGGYNDWETLACTINKMFDPSLLPKRSGKQIRSRWVNYLNPLSWSFEEDKRLWKVHEEMGKKCSVIGVTIFHATRSKNKIKNRWNCAAFRTFMEKSMGWRTFPT